MSGFVNRKLVLCSLYLKGGWQNRGHPYNYTIMGIQDGREGSHKITRKNRARQHPGKLLSNESRQKPKGLLI